MRRPFGRTLGLTLLVCFLLGVATEILVRTEYVRSHIVPSLGTEHRQFELQLARLEQLDEEDGPVDCIILGNSMVWLNVNPQLFSRAYELETGHPVLCFNFGVATMPVSAAAEVARILVTDYEPSLFIYGMSARDFAIPVDAEDARVILDSPWVRQKSGDGTVQGWLTVNTRLFRYLASFGRLLKFDSSPIRADLGSTPYNKYGFDPKQNVAREVNLEASRKDAAQWLFNYQIQPENVTALEEIAAQQRHGIQLLMVEMPVRQDYFDGFKGGQGDFQRFLDLVTKTATEDEILFWPTTKLQLVSESGWWNSNHLNLAGANMFSEWLGHQIGRAIKDGKISKSTS